jgi:hypothetical protein
MTFDEITWQYTLNKILKNATTGLISDVRYTFSGTANGQTVSIPNNVQGLAPTDPAAAGFVNIDLVTEQNIIDWIDTSIQEVVTFDIEELRAPGLVPWLDADDSKQPANQDLSAFRHSSRKEQMQESIRLGIENKIEDINANNILVEHTF